MSDKDSCYGYAHDAGTVAGSTASGVTYALLAPPTFTEATIPALFAAGVVGVVADHNVDHAAQHLCDQIYDGTTLAAVDFDSHSNVVTYSFEHEGSSHITFESYDMTCAPHDDGMCIPAQETGHSDAVDHASTGVDSTD